MLVGCATATSLFFPFVGTLVYVILRPPEYIEDVHERELEMRAAEARITQLDYSLCPHCDYRIERDFVRCPSCLRKLKERCTSCSRPLDRSWTICPYCETEVPSSEPPDAPVGANRPASGRASRRAPSIRSTPIRPHWSEPIRSRSSTRSLIRAPRQARGRAAAADATVHASPLEDANGAHADPRQARCLRALADGRDTGPLRAQGPADHRAEEDDGHERARRASLCRACRQALLRRSRPVHHVRRRSSRWCSRASARSRRPDR